MSEVVVTGLGVVGPFGLGREALAQGLAIGEPRTVEVEHGGRNRPVAALLAARLTANLTALLPPGAARRMSPPARFAVAATRLALADAGLASGSDTAECGIVTGTAWGPPWVTEQLLSQILLKGPDAASPALFTESVANASAAQMALAIQARGPTQTITQRESSDLIALAEGARLIRNGRCERVLVGVVDEIVPILHSLLDRLRALARPHADRPERARPFDARRDGFLLAEGASVLVLESLRAARARGATVLCRVHAAVAAFDPSAPAHDWGSGGIALATTLRHGLESREVATSEIDRIISGASGSRRGDRLEAAVLSALWNGRELPPVVAPKGTSGEYGGGFLAAAILALAGSPIAAPAGFEKIDPELGVRPHAGPLPRPKRALVSALSAGGTAAWAVLGEP